MSYVFPHRHPILERDKTANDRLIDSLVGEAIHRHVTSSIHIAGLGPIDTDGAYIKLGDMLAAGASELQLSETRESDTVTLKLNPKARLTASELLTILVRTGVLKEDAVIEKRDLDEVKALMGSALRHYDVVEHVEETHADWQSDECLEGLS